MKDCLDNQVLSALHIPYFEGDFWSNIMEESIKGNETRLFDVLGTLVRLELDQEEEERRKKEEVEAARAVEDGAFDDPIEAEDPTDVSRRAWSSWETLRKCIDSDLWQTQIRQHTQEEELEEDHGQPTESSEETDVQLYRPTLEDLLDHGETQGGKRRTRRDSLARLSLLGLLCHTPTKSDCLVSRC